LLYVYPVTSPNIAILFDRLRALGIPVPEDAVFHQTYVTRSSRRAGAWAWYLTDPKGRALDIGSQHTASELLQSALLVKRDANGRTSVQIDFESRPLGRLDPTKSMIGQ
jgi:hypothetical protein